MTAVNTQNKKIRTRGEKTIYKTFVRNQPLLLGHSEADTTSPSGELIFHIFFALAQFERRLIQERTRARLASARARGRLGGRPRVDLDEAKVRAARRLHDDHTLSIDDICKTLNISKSTYYRYVQMKKNS